jgi:hypothetical protein
MIGVAVGPRRPGSRKCAPEVPKGDVLTHIPRALVASGTITLTATASRSAWTACSCGPATCVRSYGRS